MFGGGENKRCEEFVMCYLPRRLDIMVVVVIRAAIQAGSARIVPCCSELGFQTWKSVSMRSNTGGDTVVSRPYG
jgi:5-formyltetrahydrofolate cyclo-ligase